METSSALVKYLSNRAFHSREWCVVVVVVVIVGRPGIVVEGSDGRGTAVVAAAAVAATSRASLIFIREISRGEARNDVADESNRGFIAPS